MDIKNDEIYPIYLNYLTTKNFSKGKIELSKISLDLFREFSKRYNDDLEFRQTQDDLFVAEKRQQVIENILEDDFEIIIQNDSKKIQDDDFFDF